MSVAQEEDVELQQELWHTLQEGLEQTEHAQIRGLAKQLEVVRLVRLVIGAFGTDHREAALQQFEIPSGDKTVPDTLTALYRGHFHSLHRM